MSLELSLIIALIAHFVGDYIIQNQWMADTKTSKWFPALVHGFTYTIPFLFATQSIAALLVIALTHAVIDRYRLAKYLIWFKNQLVPKAARYPWGRVRKLKAKNVTIQPATVAPMDSSKLDASTITAGVISASSLGSSMIIMPRQLNDKTTGFPQSVPIWMSVWLLIIVDNTVHIVINTLAIIFLGSVWVIG
jgi:hypothetical protein